MTATAVEEDLADFEKRALEIYETELKDRLIETHLGKAVAIHPDSGDYEISDTRRNAGFALMERHARDGRIVVLRIGPPTESDIQMASRILAARKS